MKKWYAAEYGGQLVIGQIFAVVKDGMILRFRWGCAFRTEQFVCMDQILGEVPDPRWLGWFFRIFER